MKRRTKKTKKRKNAGVRSYLRRALIVGLVVGFAGLFGISYRLYRGPGPAEGQRLRTTAYEEAPVRADVLHGAIGGIDRNVYQVFYKLGIDERDIAFVKVRPQQAGGIVWDYAELAVHCAGEAQARSLAESFTRHFNAINPEKIRAKIPIPDGRIIVEIWKADLQTHAIAFVWDRPADMDFRTRPKIAIVIDDLGHDWDEAVAFMSLGLPISLSILPFGHHSKRILHEADRRGLEALLHLPMEPKGYPEIDPGRGALLLAMEEAELLATLERALKELPGIKGVNNHMGSALTEDPRRMRIILTRIGKRGLFFLDSKTSPASVAYSTAREMGLKAFKRSVFLDDDPAQEAIEAQMERLLGLARHSGFALGIGHPHQTTLDVLADYYKRLTQEYELVAIARMVESD